MNEMLKIKIEWIALKMLLAFLAIALIFGFVIREQSEDLVRVRIKNDALRADINTGTRILDQRERIQEEASKASASLQVAEQTSLAPGENHLSTLNRVVAVGEKTSSRFKLLDMRVSEFVPAPGLVSNVFYSAVANQCTAGFSSFDDFWSFCFFYERDNPLARIEPITLSFRPTPSQDNPSVIADFKVVTLMRPSR